MKFNDEVVSREHRFSLGTEGTTGRHYVSIPVSNGVADYEEYYALDEAEYARYLADPDAALPLVDRCRRREEDARLIVQPGSSRGTAI